MKDDIELFEKIDKIGIKFGSRAFDCIRSETSDYDYLMTVERTEALMNKLNELKIEFEDKAIKSEVKESSGGYSYIPNNKLYNVHNLKFILDGKLINIISYKSNDFEIATDIVKSIHGLLVEENLVSHQFRTNKESRILIINGLFNAFFNLDKEIE